MNTKNIKDIELKIRELIEEISQGRSEASSIRSEDGIIADLRLDSLDYAQVYLGAEDWLGVKVDEAKINWAQIRTVSDLASLLHSAQAS